jgi:hypothetical protein
MEEVWFFPFEQTDYGFRVYISTGKRLVRLPLDGAEEISCPDAWSTFQRLLYLLQTC